jgi:hypothetical protein
LKLSSLRHHRTAQRSLLLVAIDLIIHGPGLANRSILTGIFSVTLTLTQEGRHEAEAVFGGADCLVRRQMI